MRTLLLVTIGCTPPPGGSAQPSEPDVTTAPAEAEDTVVTGVPGDPPLLEITFLGVGGYLLRVGDDVVMTPPLYTNPDFFETTFGTVASDPALVERFGSGVPFEDVDAVVVGHAHYDHLMDLPTIWPSTDDAVIYGNAATRHLLAAYAPDRDPSCASEAQDVVIPRDRVVQVDDPEGELGVDVVDYRGCPGLGDGEGEWLAVEGANVRVRALCSRHPDQVGPMHFGGGTMHEDQCRPPEHADDWREGLTLAFLVDFLDDDGVPVHRVYYQDAPSEPPVGVAAPELLEEKGVDVALLNVGNYTAVRNHPGDTLASLAPRYTIGGHWEDFFRTQDQALLPIIGHDVDDYADRAADAMVGDEAAALVAGEPSTERTWVPDPGTEFLFRAE